jgi:hypothetical protein
MMNQAPLDPHMFEDIYGIEPLAWYQNPWNIAVIIGLIITLVIIAGGIWYWYRYWRNQAWRVALQEVTRIELMLPDASVDDIYQKISKVLRTYCYRGNVCAKEVTDVELFESLLQTIPDHSAALVDTIEHIKKTKFAHITPEQDAVLSDLARLKVFIEQTKYI